MGILAMRKAMVADISRVAQKIGRTPSRQQYRKMGKFGSHVVENAFNGWSTASKRSRRML